MPNPGAQWTARPTLTLRLCVSAGKRSRARKSAENQDSDLEAVPACPTPGAQWTARPTLTLRLCVSADKRSRARKGAENLIQT